MNEPEDLRKRLADLERQVSALKRGSFRGVRRRSALVFAGLPLYDIAIGPDPERGELRGHAKGVLAFGDLATGIVALGGLARGVVAFGGLAAGILSIGGLSIGLLLAVGGAAIGSIALGGGAAGGVAIGGAAAGRYACGGTAFGAAVVSPLRHDEEAAEFFRRYGLETVCRGR